MAGLAGGANAGDWPEIQGAGRGNVWNETGLLEKFPASGLTVRWRTPIAGGYSGPAVADGRVFVSDYRKTASGPVERVLCLDEVSGKVLWTYENTQVNYGKAAYPYGPRATPTVDGESVYVLGTAGDLYCLKTAPPQAGQEAAQLRWKVNYQTDFKAALPTWGFAAAPLVYGELLICVAGAHPDGQVLALNKKTGQEVWRALSNQGGLGYAAPRLIRAGGVDQLVVWHGGALSALNPKTGAVYWSQPFPGDLVAGTPVVDGAQLLVSAFRNGSMLLTLSPDKPAAELLWKGKSASEIETDGLHALMCTPVIQDGYVYGVCSYGQFRCLDAKTGQRVWETQVVTREKARWANAFITRQDGRFFINNDRGELIIAELSPKGYHELSRTQLIKPTTPGGGQRELKLVNWVLPAYANRHILIRNDEEIIRVSLEGDF